MNNILDVIINLSIGVAILILLISIISVRIALKSIKKLDLIERDEMKKNL